MARRKFVGGKPPLFGTRQKPKVDAYVKQSPWYWWFECLKRNDAYKETCLNGGDGKLAALYNDFGDIHKTTFHKWWTTRDRGAELFAEPVTNQRVEVLTDMSSLVQSSNVLLVQIPLSLPKSFIRKRITALLKKHHSGRRGFRHNTKSSAKYPLCGRYSRLALEKALKIYDERLQNPDLPLWQIGRNAGVTKDKELLVVRKADVDKKNILANLTLRHLKKAKALIENVAKGRFPDAK